MKNKDNDIKTKNTKLNDNTIDMFSELKLAKEKAEQNWELYLGAKAEIENTIKRTKYQIDKEINLNTKRIFLDFLAYLDSLESSLKILDKDNIKYDGNQLLYKMFLKILSKYGIKKIKTKVYEKFDPNFHEALSTKLHKVYDNRIYSELQSGYTINDKILRYSKVIVFKKI